MGIIRKESLVKTELLIKLKQLMMKLIKMNMKYKIDKQRIRVNSKVKIKMNKRKLLLIMGKKEK